MLRLGLSARLVLQQPSRLQSSSTLTHLEGWNIPLDVLNPRFDICYCGLCSPLGGHNPRLLLRQRGDPPRTYAFPIGFAMKLPAGVTPERMDRLHVAFHGTKCDAAIAILSSQNPQLLLPGTETESGFVLPIRDGHIPGKFERTNKYTGTKEQFDPNQIFMSPTIKYCEHRA